MPTDDRINKMYSMLYKEDTQKLLEQIIDLLYDLNEQITLLEADKHERAD